MCKINLVLQDHCSAHIVYISYMYEYSSFDVNYTCTYYILLRNLWESIRIELHAVTTMMILIWRKHKHTHISNTIQPHLLLVEWVVAGKVVGSVEMPHLTPDGGAGTQSTEELPQLASE